MPETFKQVAEKLNSSSSILIVLPSVPSPDAIASGLALANFLKRMEKDAVVVASDASLNNQVDFLVGFDQVLREMNVSKSFVIKISTKRSGLSELSYKKESDHLAIHLKAKNSDFTSDDVTFATSKFPYDAVVVLGAPSLDNLGVFYSKNAELFFETPVINIDFKGANQGFGQFNLVEVNASSISEIVYDLILQIEQEFVDEHVATSLLTGIIAETNSFQNNRTTPQSFVKSSRLINSGAKQQDIINQLYKNKSMGFLKLWGTVLATLKHEPENSLAYSAVNRGDLEKAGATLVDSASIIKEMVQQLAFVKIHLFLIETAAQQTQVYVSAPVSFDLRSVFAQFQPQLIEPRIVRFTIEQDAIPAQQQVIEILHQSAKKL